MPVSRLPLLFLLTGSIAASAVGGAQAKGKIEPGQRPLWRKIAGRDKEVVDWRSQSTEILNQEPFGRPLSPGAVVMMTKRGKWQRAVVLRANRSKITGGHMALVRLPDNSTKYLGVDQIHLPRQPEEVRLAYARAKVRLVAEAVEKEFAAKIDARVFFVNPRFLAQLTDRPALGIYYQKAHSLYVISSHVAYATTTLAHEMVHSLVSRRIDPTLRNFNEGAAEYLSTLVCLERLGHLLPPGKGDPYLPYYQFFLRVSELIGREALVGFLIRSPDPVTAIGEAVSKKVPGTVFDTALEHLEANEIEAAMRVLGGPPAIDRP